MISFSLRLGLDEYQFFAFPVVYDIPIPVFFLQFFFDIFVSIFSIILLFCSMNIISNSLQESSVCIRLHSSSDQSVVSVISFTCCDLHMRAKWFGSLQFLHCIHIAAQFFKCPSVNSLPHRLHDFLSSVLYLAGALPSGCFCLLLSRLYLLFC